MHSHSHGKGSRGHRRKSTRIRALKRDSAPLVLALEGYAVQATSALTKLYDDEPDEGYWPQVEDREAELYGPFLIHTKLIGPEAEARLLAAVEKFTSAKADIKSEDATTAKAIALLEVLEGMSGDTFIPGDLVAGLAEYDAWSYNFAKVKGSDEKSKHRQMSAQVGYALRSYRLQGKRIGGTVRYPLRKTIDTLRSHVPENYPNHPNHPDHPEDTHTTAQAVENETKQDTQDSKDTFEGAAAIELPQPRRRAWSGACPGCELIRNSTALMRFHLNGCHQFNMPRMVKVEAALDRGESVDGELAQRYRRYLDLGLGRLSGGVH